MNPLTEKQLEKMLKQAPSGADLDRAVESLVARAERDGLIDVAYASVDSPFGRLLVARTDRGVVTFDVVVKNQHGDKVATGEAMVEFPMDLFCQ